MNIQNDLLLGLNTAKLMSTATLSYVSGSTTLSASVYQSFGKTINFKTDEYEHIKQYTDFSVMANTTDVASWGLIPLDSKVKVNNIPYMVGGVITDVENCYSWISLRNYTSMT